VKDGALRENGLKHRDNDAWGWGSCCDVEVKKKVGETCRRHANIVSKDQPTLIIESRK
jgi:hypothetical protein